MRKMQLIGAIAVMIPFTAVAADTAQMTAGRWGEVLTVTSATLDGKPLPTDADSGKAKTKFWCISPEQAIDPAKHFLKAGADSTCKPGGSVSGGRIVLDGTCTNKAMGQMTITGEGAYRLESYDVSARIASRMNDMPVIFDMAIKGRHVGPCNGTESK